MKCISITCSSLQPGPCAQTSWQSSSPYRGLRLDTYTVELIDLFPNKQKKKNNHTPGLVVVDVWWKKRVVFCVKPQERWWLMCDGKNPALIGDISWDHHWPWRGEWQVVGQQCRQMTRPPIPVCSGGQSLSLSRTRQWSLDYCCHLYTHNHKHYTDKHYTLD